MHGLMAVVFQEGMTICKVDMAVVFEKGMTISKGFSHAAFPC